MKRTTLLLLLILFLASVLRLTNISTNPPAIYWEEAALGYDAYSIFKTGHDYHGNLLPILAFPSFGDYKPSLYFYAIVPFLAMFGQSTLAIRLPSAIAGIITVWLVFLIGKKLKDERYGLVAAFIFAIQPWSVHLSRIGFEANLALMLLTAGVYFLLESKKKMWCLVLSAAFLIFSMYAYHADRIVAPLLALWMGISLGLVKKSKWFIFALGLAIVCIIPIVINLKNPIIAQRAAETSILSGSALVEKSNILREADGNTVLARFIHHRFVIMGKAITSQYLNNFSPIFLFFSGDGNLRHTNGMVGALYAWEIITVLVGVYVLLNSKNSSLRTIIFPWIIISAIPAAFTTVSPHALRFLSAAPAFALLSAIGLLSIVEFVRTAFRSYVLFAAGSVILVSLLAFLHAEFVLYPKTSAREWQYGYKELVESIDQLKKPSQKAFITREQGRPSIYFLWYTNQNPADIQAMNSVLKKDQQELLEFGPYQFGDRIPSETGLLIANSPMLTPSQAKVLKNITLPTGEVIWNIWEK